MKFSDNTEDLSNCASLDDFLESFGQIIDNTSQFLENNRYCAVVIGDKYANSEIVPLGFYCMNLFIQRGFKLKAILVKNFEETKGKSNQKAIWRYRALASDFFIFKHEYIFVFKKINKLWTFSKLCGICLCCERWHKLWIHSKIYTTETYFLTKNVLSLMMK